MRFLKSIFCIAVAVLAAVMMELNTAATEYDDISEDYEQLLDGIPEDVAVCISSILCE